MARDDTDERTEGIARSDAWTDLGLTLPIFVLYHLGVIFLPTRNAADLFTTELTQLANHSLLAYAGLTLAIGLAFVGVLALAGRRTVLRPGRFVWIGAEGVAYALAMRWIGAWALDALPLAPAAPPAPVAGSDVFGASFAAVVMSLGAGFYEELVFRVGLFGAGAWVVKQMWAEEAMGGLLLLAWGLVSALAFSGWHHIGPLADAFDARVFAYRAVCGLMLTLIYGLRGFAPAVWTHTVYDLWALA
jgi:hypothetical protein